MKTGNTLRTAKNSLLCFFMALAGGFLVACGSSSDGVGSPTPRLAAPTHNVTTPTDPPSFSAYLLDTAVEGVSYSGPTGDGVTGEGGVFNASEGVFEFSIGGTALGSVQMNSNQENNEVTPSDFIGLEVESEQVITIARIMQALDADDTLQNGISISQSARANTLDLFSAIDTQRLADGRPHSEPVTVLNFDGTSPLTISSREDARSHLVATRQCLFSGGYVGDYRANGDLDERGTVYYAVEPFADRVRRFGFTVDVSALQSFDGEDVSDVNVSRVNAGTEAILISQGAEGGAVDVLNFITPRLVDGRWDRVDGENVIASGTHVLAAVAGDPGATRRIVGVQTPNDDDDAPAAGMYVLDYFANDNGDNGGSFSGQYYDVVNAGTVSVSPLMLTIATDGGSWASVAMSGLTTTLTLIGTRGESDMAITLQIVRADDNHGTVSGVFADLDTSKLSGTWCDIGGAVGSTVAPTPPPLSNIPEIVVITWDAVPGATVYNLYRSTVSVGMYNPIATVVAADGAAMLTHTDNRPSGPDYFYRVEACNSAGCSGNDPDPAAGGGDGNGNGNGGGGSDAPAQPSAPSASAQSDTEIEVTWSAVSSATSYKLYRSESSGGTYAQVGGDISELSYLDTGRSADTEYFYQLEACNSAGCSERSPEVSATTQPPDDGQCRVGQRLMVGQSCNWKIGVFTAEADGTGVYVVGGISNIKETELRVRGNLNGVDVVFSADKIGDVWQIAELG